MNYTRDIKDERQGARHYKQMARRSPSQRIALESMSADESKHGKMLGQMKRAKAISKAKNK